MKILDAHQMFLSYLESLGRSQNTLYAYHEDARLLVKFLHSRGVSDDLEQLTSSIFRQFTVWMKENGYSTNTIRRKLDSLSSFSKYLEYEELAKNNMFNVKKPKPPKKLPLHLTEHELKRLLYAVDHSKGIFKTRDQAVIRVLSYMGLRRSELIKLDWEHVDFNRGVAAIIDPKGNNDRTVPMNEEVQEHLWEYLQTRLPLKQPAVFLNRYRNRITPNCISRIIDKHRKKAGIEKPITAHSLRHTCGTLLIEKGVDIVTVKELLGHSDINSTLIYTHTSKKRVADAVAKLQNL